MRTNEKTIENLVETRWLPRYPWVMEIIYYQLPEFICRVLKDSISKKNMGSNTGQYYHAIQLPMQYFHLVLVKPL